MEVVRILERKVVAVHVLCSCYGDYCTGYGVPYEVEVHPPQYLLVVRELVETPDGKRHEQEVLELL